MSLNNKTDNINDLLLWIDSKKINKNKKKLKINIDETVYGIRK